MKLPKAKKKTKPCTLRKGQLAWNKNVALVKYADGFLLFVLTPSLSEFTSQYSQKDQSVWSKDHPVASCVYSPLRGWVYFILIWMIFSLFSPDVAAAELLCRRRGNLWPCFSLLIHKQMEVFGSDLPKLIQPQTECACSSHFTSPCLFVPLVPYFSSRRTCWMTFPLPCARHPACARSHISSAASHSMSNMTRVKNMCPSGDKTSFGREILVVACLQ